MLTESVVEITNLTQSGMPRRIKSGGGSFHQLVIDNYHNPQGKPIVEVANCEYVELINFPSVKAPGLMEVFKENGARLGL